MLPGPTFVKTFLRTYSEALGLDPHLLVEEYRATYESREEMEQVQTLGPPGVGRDRRRGGPRRPRGPWVAVALMLAGVLVALLVIGLVGGDDEGDGGQASEPTETQPQAAAHRAGGAAAEAHARGPSDRSGHRDLRVHRYRAGDRHPLRGDHRRPADLSRASPAREPRQHVRGDHQERQALCDRGEQRPGRLCLHSHHNPSAAPGRAALRVDERAGGDRGHRHGGAHRPRAGPKRALAVRPPVRAGHRAGSHHDLRGPPRGHAGAAAVHGRPGGRPRDHERRPRADRRRPHDRGGCRVHGAPAVSRRGARAADRGHSQAADEALSRRRLRRDSRVEPKAGAGARRCARDLPGRHRPGSRRAGQAGDRGAARPAARASRDVAAGRRDGRLPGGCWDALELRAADAAAVRHPGVGDRRDAAGGGGGDRGL